MSHRLRRLSGPALGLALLGCLAALPALAQSAKGGSSAPAQPPARKKAAPAGSAASKAKPTTPMGGYSWSDKHRRGHHRRYHRHRFHFDPNAPIAMFPGFRMLPGGKSMVWVTISRKVPVEVHRAAGRVTYMLSGAEVSIRNNTNALVTTYFDTPLSRARLVPTKQGTELLLELREKVEPSYKVRTGPGGTMVLSVTLPKPSKSFRPPNAAPIRRTKQTRFKSMFPVLPAPRGSSGRPGPNP